MSSAAVVIGALWVNVLLIHRSFRDKGSDYSLIKKDWRSRVGGGGEVSLMTDKMQMMVYVLSELFLILTIGQLLFKT